MKNRKGTQAHTESHRQPSCGWIFTNTDLDEEEKAQQKSRSNTHIFSAAAGSDARSSGGGSRRRRRRREGLRWKRRTGGNDGSLEEAEEEERDGSLCAPVPDEVWFSERQKWSQVWREVQRCSSCGHLLLK